MPRNKRTRSKKQDTRLSRTKNVVRGGFSNKLNGIETYITESLRQAPDPDFLSFANWLSLSPYSGTAKVATCDDEAPSESGTQSSSTNILNSHIPQLRFFIDVCAQLEAYSQTINKWIGIQSDLSAAALADEFNAFEHSISAIEGVDLRSLWLAQVLMYYYTTLGLRIDKSAIKSVLPDSTHSDLIEYFFGWIVEKHGSLATQESWINDINSLASTETAGRQRLFSVRYLVLGEMPSDLIAIREIVEDMFTMPIPLVPAQSRA